MIAVERLEELKSKHGEVHVLSAGEFEIAVRSPSRADVKRWQDTTGRDRSRGPAATEQLVRDCVVHPTHDEYDAIVERKPLLPMTFGAKVLEIAGAVEDCEAKKA